MLGQYATLLTEPGPPQSFPCYAGGHDGSDGSRAGEVALDLLKRARLHWVEEVEAQVRDQILDRLGPRLRRRHGNEYVHD